MFYKKLLVFTIIPIILYFLFPYIKDIVVWIMNLIDLYRVDIFILVILPTIVLFISYILCPNWYDKNKSSAILSPDIEFKNYDKNKIVGVKNIINSHNDNTFFSLALVGDWGSGKSSFLKKLKKEIELKNKDIVIYLNVWELENIQNILQEIEKEFDNIIFKLSLVEWIIYHLKSILVKSYFSLLSKYFTKHNIKIEPPFSNTIKDSKDDYNILLKRVLEDKKIVLMLDELDRLESKEDVLNIFKVIRYLTSFDKVFTITGIDINKLPKGIELEYTHKIFNSKYVIPKTTRNELLTFLIEKGSEQLSDFIDKEKFNKILNTNIDDINLCLIDFITTYREAKSILNDTYMFCNSLKENPKFRDNWNKFIDFELILVLNILKSVNLEFYLKFMNENERIQLFIINSTKPTKITELLTKYDNGEKEPTLSEDEKTKINAFFKYKYTSMISNLKYRIENLNQNLYVYIHQNIYDFMFTEDEYKEFLKDTSLIKNKINELIQNNLNENYKDNFIEFIIKRLYEENDKKNIRMVIKTIFEDETQKYLLMKILTLLESYYSLNVMEELFEFAFRDDLNDKFNITHFIGTVININKENDLLKILFKNIKEKYEKEFKYSLLNAKGIRNTTESLKELVIIVNNILEEDYNTFFKNEEIYNIYFKIKENSFSSEEISGQKLKQMINENNELQEELKKYKESKSENKGEK